MIGAGVLFYSKSTKRFLFLLRNNTRTRGTWGIPGGKLQENETVMAGLLREIKEELGEIPEVQKYIPLEKFTSFDEQFCYHSFLFVIENEFLPTLNDEHGGYCWTKLDKFPKPLHPGLFQSLNLSVIQDKIKVIEESL